VNQMNTGDNVSGIRWLRNIWDGKIAKTMNDQKMAGLADLMAPRKIDIELIRLGGAEDGGYLVPDDLEGITACFSPGVADKADFEEEMLTRDIVCFLADASVEAPPISDDRITFDPLFIGPRTKQGFLSLDDWVNRYRPGCKDMILQMDIEGAEYEVLDAVSPAILGQFRVLVIEFHRVHLALLSDGNARLSRVFEKLHEQFIPVHAHPNNARPPLNYGKYSVPRALEITFIAKDRASALGKVTTFPHILDTPNVARNADFALPEWIYR
jgi:hypothetical protein